MRSGEGIRTGACTVCRHPEVARINFLAAQGAPRAPLARQFGLGADAVQRHVKRHVSPEYKRGVLLGPFRDEEHLRKLCAEAGTSVLDNLRSIYSGLAARWLVSYKSGGDATLAMLTSKLHENLGMQARLTRELLPTPTTVTNNFFALPIFGDLQSRLLIVLRDFPEARAAVLREFKALADGSPPMIEVQADDVRAT